MVKPMKNFIHVRKNTEGNSYFVDLYCYPISEEDIKNIKMQAEEVSDFKIADIFEIEEIAKRGEFLHFENVKEVLYNI